MNLRCLILLIVLFTATACGGLVDPASASGPDPQNRVMPSEFQPEPKDILSQLDLFGAGGGGSCGNLQQSSNSFDTDPRITLYGPYMERIGDPALIPNAYSICLNNFSVGETVNVTLIEPGGTEVKVAEILVDDFTTYNWSIIWQTLPGMSEGNYRLIAESETTLAQYNFEVQSPQSPIIDVARSEIEIGNQFANRDLHTITVGERFKIMYAGFEPHQKITVFVGNTDGPEYYNARWVTEIDKNGQAIDIVEIPESEITDAFEERKRSFLESKGIEADSSVMVMKLFVYVALGGQPENDGFVILDGVSSYVDVYSD